MKKSALLLAGLVLLVGAIYLWQGRGPASDTEIPAPVPSETSGSVAESSPSATPGTEGSLAGAPPGAPQASPGAPRSDEGPGSGSAAPIGKVTPPTSSQVREEVARDPETPSRSMLHFTIELEHKMERALVSAQAADAFFPELDHCASNSGTEQLAENARVLCLSNADRLVSRYPELHGRYENLESRLDARIVKLKKLMDIK